MANEQLKAEIRQAGLRQWQVADLLHIHEITFTKRLRHELSREDMEKIRNLIQQHISAKEGGK